MKLADATALVTGASSEIGRAIAKALAAEGARVALVGRNEDGLRQTEALIKQIGGETRIFIVDLRDESAISRFVATVQAHWGGVDILANMAGVWHDEHRPYIGLLQDTAVEEIDEVLDVNLRAPMLLSRLLIPGMIKKKQGKILNISGPHPEAGYAFLHYYVAKTAVEHLTLGLANELREHNIQVNCISPWDTDTEGFRKFATAELLETAISADTVAKLAMFLIAHDVADLLTGQVIVIGNEAVGPDWTRAVLAEMRSQDAAQAIGDSRVP